jgi:hypothetical protein
MFFECYSLEKITIQNVEILSSEQFHFFKSNVSSIGSQSFDSVHILSVILSNGILAINSTVFSGCLKLSSLIVEKPFNAFSEWKVLLLLSFKNLTVDSYPLIINKVLNLSGSNISYIPPSVFQGSGIIEAFLPNSVSSIEKSVFQDCYNLQKVTIEYPFREINSNLFQSCSNLTFISINKFPLLSNNTLQFNSSAVNSIKSNSFSNLSSMFLIFLKILQELILMLFQKRPF